MSFLLSSFFTVPVSSTMGLPLRWVSLPSASSTGASLSWAPAVLGLFHAEVVSARLNPSHGTIGEGNGTPLQYSCLENPMDGGAWWAAVHGVAKSRTRLSDFTSTFMHWRRKWQPTPVFLPGESQGRGSLVGYRLWGRTESDTTEAT